MRTRQIIIAVVFTAGLLFAGAGAFITRYSDRSLAGSQLFEVALAFMAGAVVYLMATDDPKARASMLGEAGHTVTDKSRDVDLRGRAAKDELATAAR
jgi:uncharacterized membrane protein YraQ (UPF0718 family)